MSWLSESIMHRRGVAHGQVTATHVDRGRPGDLSFIRLVRVSPRCSTSPQAPVSLSKHTTPLKAIWTERDLPRRCCACRLSIHRTAPSWSRGIGQGDTLAVYIESMAPRGRIRGTCCMIPEFGALTGTTYTATSIRHCRKWCEGGA